MTTPLNPQVNPSQPPLVTWRGKSGTEYHFQRHPIGTVYFERPGVYIFIAPAGIFVRAIYVGQTDNFRRRLTDELATHHQWQSVIAAGATEICTLYVPGGEAERLRIETDLRHALNPPCNLQ